jgi:hypothetical protein
MVDIFFGGAFPALMNVVLDTVVRIPEPFLLKQVPLDPVLVPQIHEVVYFDSVAAVGTRKVLLLISLAQTTARSIGGEIRGRIAGLTTFRRGRSSAGRWNRSASRTAGCSSGLANGSRGVEVFEYAVL